MQILTDTATIVATATLHPDPELRRLLGLRIESLAEFGDIAELMQVLVLEPGDTAAELGSVPGLPALTTCYPSLARCTWTKSNRTR